MRFTNNEERNNKINVVLAIIGYITVCTAVMASITMAINKIFDKIFFSKITVSTNETQTLDETTDNEI